MDTIQELTECLALQQEIDAKTLELRKRYKAVILAERERGNKHTIVVKIGDEMYSLEREGMSNKLHRESTEHVFKLQGYYLYRLFKLGNVVK